MPTARAQAPFIVSSPPTASPNRRPGSRARGARVEEAQNAACRRRGARGRLRTARPRIRQRDRRRPARLQTRGPAERGLSDSSTRTTSTKAATRIRVGIGGWTYEPWRDNFYPAGLPHKQELAFASRRLTAIEVNGTFYGSFKPETFRKWHDETPDDFVFSLKASRFATNRKLLATAGESIARFVDSGIGELGTKLGPIVWQLAPTKVFEAGDLGGFLELLPRALGGRALRHALEVRHESFATPGFVALARQHAVATVYTDSGDYPTFADATGDFVYARLMRSEADVKEGYAPKALDAWAAVARTWAAGGAPESLPTIGARTPAAGPRDVFIHFINGAKEKAPAAAMGLIRRLA